MEHITAVWQLVPSMLPGAVAGTVTVLLGHPFDTVKTRMQNQASFAAPGAAAAGSTARLSVIHQSKLAVVDTYHSGGLRAFYRGASVPLLVTGAKRSVQFSLWEALMDRMKQRGAQGDGVVPMWAERHTSFIAGGVCGALGTLVSCPFHVVKIGTQVTDKTQIKNAVDCAWQLVRSNFQRAGAGGVVRALYRGLLPHMMKDVVFAGSYLGIYGRLRGLGKEIRSDPSSTPLATRGNLTVSTLYNSFLWGITSSFASGAIASITVWSVLLPFDTVKTLVQAGGMHRTDDAQTTRGVLRRIVVSDIPIRRLWRGTLVSVVKAGPVSGFSMLAYELTRAQLRSKE